MTIGLSPLGGILFTEFLGGTRRVESNSLVTLTNAHFGTPSVSTCFHALRGNGDSTISFAFARPRDLLTGLGHRLSSSFRFYSRFTDWSGRREYVAVSPPPRTGLDSCPIIRLKLLAL